MAKYTKIDKLLEEAQKLIWIEIEKEVTKILLSPRNRMVTFITAMGGWFFVDSDGLDADDKHYMKTLDGIYEQYNDMFKMYGAGIRWDLVDGKVIKTTDW